MALSPYASAEEKALYAVNEKLDRVLAILDRKTPEDYTRIAREEAEKVFDVYAERYAKPVIAPYNPAFDSTLVGVGDSPAARFLESLPNDETALNLQALPSPKIVPAVVDNAERVDDEGPLF